MHLAVPESVQPDQLCLLSVRLFSHNFDAKYLGN